VRRRRFLGAELRSPWSFGDPDAKMRPPPTASGPTGAPAPTGATGPTAPTAPTAPTGATARLARDLGGAGAPPARVTPWGLEYDGLVIATAVPPPEVARRWETRVLTAASDSVRHALDRVGIAATTVAAGSLWPLPDRSLRAGDHASGVVRCDDDGGAALGAFLLCWALQRPHASLSAGHPLARRQARALGCPVGPAGPPAAVVVCAGGEAYPPPVAIDALAAGVAVVGIGTPGLVGVVGDAGLLVDPGAGVETLGEALAAVLGDAALAAEMGRRGPPRLRQLDPAAALALVAARLRSA